MANENKYPMFICTKCGKFSQKCTNYYWCGHCEAKDQYIKVDLTFDDFCKLTQQERESYRLKILAQHGVVIGPEVKCPYCGSPNTDKIKATSRMFSVGLFGLGSSKAGKQWHCNKCGSNF